MEPGTVMYYNWNRMAYLDKKKRTPEIDVEKTMRTQFQNAFACAATDEDAFKISHDIVEPTLLKEVINSVDSMMRKVKSK